MAATSKSVRSLAARVAAGAAAQLGRYELESFEPLPGGHSGLTWHAVLRGGGGAARHLVVKSVPEGREPAGRHDVLRQARAMRALSGLSGVPVPAICFEDAEAPQLFAMELVEGRAGEPLLDEPGAGEPEPAPELSLLWAGAAEVLAHLAAADPAELGFGGEPVFSPQAEVERWSATARAVGGSVEAAAAALADALRARLPTPAGPPALVHGDFRLGNMLRRQGRVLALIDWEIWSLGDPRTDLGWLLLFTDASAFPGLRRPAPGTPTAARLLAEYEELRGEPVADAEWFRALACLKLGAVQAHNLRRHRDGRRPDPFLERFERTVPRLFELGGQLLA